MKKFFTLCAVALCAMTVNAQAFYSWEDDMSQANSVTNAAGYTLEITSDPIKTLSKGNASFVIDGTTYKTVKLSNGQTNTLTAPSGQTFRYVTLYSYLNCSVKKLKTNADGKPYIRDSYWDDVNGTSYTFEEKPLKVTNLSADDLATVANGSNFISTTDDGTVFDVYTFDLGANVSSFTFKNTGEQPGVVIEVSDKPVTPTGIAKVLTGAKVINENAPAYNLSGQRVGKDYKGIVIKNGQKFFNK